MICKCINIVFLLERVNNCAGFLSKTVLVYILSEAYLKRIPQVFSFLNPPKASISTVFQLVALMRSLTIPSPYGEFPSTSPNFRIRSQLSRQSQHIRGVQCAVSRWTAKSAVISMSQVSVRHFSRRWEWRLRTKEFGNH